MARTVYSADGRKVMNLAIRVRKVYNILIPALFFVFDWLFIANSGAQF